MILRHDLNVPYIKNEIKRFSQRYADRMEEHPNIFATILMKEVKTTRRLKKNYLKTHVPERTAVLWSKRPGTCSSRLPQIIKRTQSDR